jgi:hypothetical protein
MKSASAATAITGKGRLAHDQLGNRHKGCPCTAGGKH